MLLWTRGCMYLFKLLFLIFVRYIYIYIHTQEWNCWVTWVWVNSRSLWWIGRPGMLQFMGSQRVGHDWATDFNWTEGSSVFSFLRNLHSVSTEAEPIYIPIHGIQGFPLLYSPSDVYYRMGVLVFAVISFHCCHLLFCVMLRSGLCKLCFQICLLVDSNLGQ